MPKIRSAEMQNRDEMWLQNCQPTAMLSRRGSDCALLIGAVALTRILFRSHYLYDLDSVDFALAIGRFDPAVFQPHPPGYFLYVCLARLLNGWFHDANASLVAISFGASCAAAPFIYLLAHEWFGIRAARFAGAIFLFSPLAWFHGIVALTYIVEGFFSALIGYLCWRVYTGSTREVLAAAVALGVAAGLRPSSLLFLGPVFLFSLRKAPRNKIAAALAALSVTVLAWFVPMIYASGGPQAYLSSLAFLWQLSPGRQNAVNSFLLLSLVRLVTIAGIFALCFGSFAGFFALPLADRRKRVLPQVVFTWVWIAPALLFFTFVFLRFINSGYLLVVFPPVCAWVAGWGADWFERSRWQVFLKAGLAGAGVALNILIFLRAPLYCSWGSVKSFEAQLDRVRRALPRVATPGKTLLVGFDSHFLGFRHAGYYFPDYTTAEFPEVKFPGGERAFLMQGRDTRLEASIATQEFAGFVLFPLPPSGEEFRRYSEQMRSMFPSSLQSVPVDGVDFLTGPIEELPVLFPNTAKRTQSVYTASNLPSPAVYKR